MNQPRPPQPTVVIVPMTENDIDRVMEIAAGQPHAPSWTRDAYLAAIDSAAAQKRVSLVAKSAETDNVQGFIIANLNAPESELETIVTAQLHQRQGIARQLFRVLLAELHTAGVGQITLEVRPSNHPAIALYRSLGFNQLATRPAYYSHPTEDALLMTLDFS